MAFWLYSPAFLATAISIVGWTYMAVKEHNNVSPQALSELGAARSETLAYFRCILWICGVLFGITMYFFVIPRIDLWLLHTLAWSMTLFGEVLLGVYPAIGKTKRLHDMLAMIMGVGMLAMSYLFWWSFGGIFMYVEMGIALAMTLLAILTIIRFRIFIVYELLFIFLSHISILVAVIALK
jgi:hypothetical protein